MSTVILAQKLCGWQNQQMEFKRDKMPEKREMNLAIASEYGKLQYTTFFIVGRCIL